MIDDFLQLEEEYKLFDKSYKGVPIWPLVREEVYFKIEREKNEFNDNIKKDSDMSFLLIIIKLYHILINTIKYYLQKKTKSDLLFVAHPRRKKIDNYFIDIYTDPIIDVLDFDVKIIEPMFQLGHFKPVRNEILYLDAIEFWSRIYSKLKGNRLSNKELKYWQDIETHITKKFNINELGITELIKTELNRFLFSLKYIDNLINEFSPQLILLVVGYHRINKVISFAAHKQNINTIELQHGVIYKEHIAYNFPDNVEVKTFPKYLSAWGEFWKKNNRAPISNERILVNGFKFFDDKRDIYTRNNKEKKKSILFMSQGINGDKLSKIAISLASEIDLDEYEIVYKLHPAEYSDRFDRYKYLYQTNGIVVQDSMDSDIYQLIIDSYLVVGVFSTALIEALGLGRKTVVYKLPGWNYMKNLLDDTSINICAVNSLEELKNEINYKAETSYEYNSSYLFSSYSKSFLNILE